MAIAKVVYKENASATPEVWMDTTQKTVTAGTMLSGTTALKNDGTGITGNIASKSSSDLTVSGATVTAPAGYYSNAASKAVASGSASTPATSITANPTISVNASGLITASVSGSKSVTPTVSAGYVSSGTAGTVSVSGSNTQQLSTQAGTTITPTESEQTAVASGKYTTGAVKVGAISSTYVGSGITQRDSTDLTASGATVTAPAGYYAEAASKSVASGSAGTPTATKGTVSSHSVSVTPSVTNTTGYITGGTLTGTAVTVSASELVSGTKSITSSGTTDVTNYASASVAAGTAGTPTATKGTVSNHSISVTPSVTNTTGYITGSTINGTAVTVNVSELESGTKSITENGTGISVSGYSAVDVAVPGQVPTGIKYIWTDYDFTAQDVSSYAYCSVDGSPLSDGVYRVWVNIPADSLGITLKFDQGRTTNSIDWGDGTTSATGGTVNHTYSASGRYIIKVTYSIKDYPAVRAFNQISDTSMQTKVEYIEYAAYPQNSISLPANTYQRLTSLKCVYIPAYVSSIGAGAFSECTSLIRVVCYATTPPTLGSSAFYNSGNAKIYVPANSVDSYKQATNWSTYADRIEAIP